MKKPNKKKCIKEYCLGCSGDSPKEVTFCNILDCPLWPFRTGSYIDTSLYRRRIEKAFQNHPSEVADLAAMGLKKEDFLRLPEREGGFGGLDEAGEAESCALMA